MGRRVLGIWAGSALLGATLVLPATGRYGLALTPDSGVFLAAARSLRASGALLSFDGEPFVAAPPLYPVLLSAASGLEATPPAGLRYAGALLFAVFAALAAALLTRIGHRTGAGGTGAFLPAVAGILALLLCKPLVELSSSLWSETLFLPLLAGFLLAATSWPARGPTPLPGLLGAALLASALALTRYPGVAAAGAGTILLLLRPAPLRTRVRECAVFAAVSLGPISTWLLRNRTVSGTWAGPRGAAGATLVQNLGALGETAIAWAGLTRLPPAAAMVVILLVSALGAAGLIRHAPARRAVSACICFAVVYLLLMLLLASTLGFDRLDERLLSPLLLPLAAIGLASFQVPRGAAARRTVGAAALLWLTGSGLRVAAWERHASQDGAGGFATSAWQSSPLARAIESAAGETSKESMLSNEPSAVYLLTSRPARLSPRRNLYRSTAAAPDDLPRLRWMIESGAPVLIAWFTTLDTPHVFRPEELPEALTGAGAAPLVLEETAKTPDGSLYRLSLTPATPAPRPSG